MPRRAVAAVDRRALGLVSSRNTPPLCNGLSAPARPATADIATPTAAAFAASAVLGLLPAASTPRRPAATGVDMTGSMTPQFVLAAAVTVVGVLHTIVPDHWLPIAIVARQRGWTRGQTARAALGAGAGHVVSTLLLGILVWLGGTALATRFGGAVSALSSAALVGFGAWFALSALRELRDHDRAHAAGIAHDHAHGHGAGAALDLATDGTATARPAGSSRTALLLILGSSPMVEGIPAFFAAGRYGAALVVVMAILFALATIATYVVLCVFSSAGLERLRLGPFERYGEVLSGALIMLVGAAFYVWPAL